MPEFVAVEREPVKVVFKRSETDTVEAIQRAWAEFEAAVGLHGRKFLGAFYESTHEYRVCTLLKEGDDPAAEGLEVDELPGGSYLRAHLQGEHPAVYDLIQPTFEQMLRHSQPDLSRPSIEFYRSRDVIDLLLPIA